MSDKRDGDLNSKSSPSNGHSPAKHYPDPDSISPSYQTRWISKQRLGSLRKSGSLKDAVLVDYRSGFLIIEPKGSDLGDGDIIPLETADYELRSVWCLTPKPKLLHARKLLGLSSEA